MASPQALRGFPHADRVPGLDVLVQSERDWHDELGGPVQDPGHPLHQLRDG